MKAQKWQEAISALEQAIAIDPTPSAGKLEEGVFRTDYFPQYYLFVAYLKTNQFAKARQAFQSRGVLTPKLNTEAQAYLAELVKADGAAGAIGEFERLAAAGDAALAAKQYADAAKAFESARDKLPDEFTKRNLQARLTDARNGLAQVQAAAAQAERRRAADAARVLQDAARNLAAEGQRLVTAGKLGDARAKFQAAQAQLAGSKEAADGLADIQRREREYTASKDRADQLSKGGNLAAARDELVKARDLHPEWFERDRLASSIANIDKMLGSQALVDAARKAFDERRWADAASAAASALQSDPGNRDIASLRSAAESRLALDAARGLAASGRYNEADAKYSEAVAKDASNKDATDALAGSRRYADLVAQGRKLAQGSDQGGAKKVLDEARQIDGARFAREGLTALLSDVKPTAPAPPPPDAPAALQRRSPEDLAREGLIALFNGAPRQAIPMLDEALAGSSKTDKTRRATLYAYLGVAYATLSFQSPADSSDQWKTKALEQFHSALALERGYRLSERLVSPRVRDLFDRAAKSGSNH